MVGRERLRCRLCCGMDSVCYFDCDWGFCAEEDGEESGSYEIIGDI
jgi:hypothetical protein